MFTKMKTTTTIKSLLIHITLLLLMMQISYTQDLNFVRSMDIPEGGHINAQLFYNNELYAVSGNEEVAGIVYKLVDSAWEVVLYGGNDTYFTSIYEFNGILLVGTNNKGVYKSLGGKNFQLITEGLINHEFGILSLGNIIQFTNAHDRLYFLSQNEGIFYSDDTGESWERLPDENNFENLSFIYGTTEHLYIGSDDNGILRSEKKFNNWEDFNAGFNLSNQPVFIKQINNNMYLGSSFGLQVYSEDSIRWVSPEDENNSIYYTFNKVLNLEKNNNDLYLMTDDFWRVSKDSGRTWQEYDIALYPNIRVATAENNYFYLNYEDGNTYKKDIINDSVELISNGMSNMNCYSGIISNKELLLSQNMATNINIYALDNDGSFTSNSNFNKRKVRSIVKGHNKLYALADKSMIFESLDNGRNWQGVFTGKFIGHINNLHFANDLLYIGTQDYAQGTFILDNNKILNEIWNLPDDDNLGMTSINENMFALIKNKGIYKSTDSGQSWENITDNIDKNFEFNNFVDIKADDDKLVVVRNTGEIYLSINLGEYWSQINTDEEPIRRNNLTFFKDLIIVSKEKGGVEYTSNYGFSWDTLSFNGIEDVKINDILFYADKLYFLTNGYGVWKSDYYLSTQELVIANNISLSPMPSKEFVTLEMNIEKSGNLEIGIYNFQGQKIRHFPKNYISEGKITKSIDLNGLSSGTYLIITKLNNDIFYNKLIIQK